MGLASKNENLTWCRWRWISIWTWRLLRERYWCIISYWSIIVCLSVANWLSLNNWSCWSSIAITKRQKKISYYLFIHFHQFDNHIAIILLIWKWSSFYLHYSLSFLGKIIRMIRREILMDLIEIVVSSCFTFC